MDLTKVFAALMAALLGSHKASSGADFSGTSETNAAPASITAGSGKTEDQSWNWHVQSTGIVQGYPAFAAKYSGPNSLRPGGEVRETISFDLMAGARLWKGAEAHIDGLMWQGFGVSKTLGIEAFPNGEGFRLGTSVPNVNFARLFLRQVIDLGGENEAVNDGPLQLAGNQSVSRVTLTLGKLSAKDIFDNNAYANDARTQFMSWAFMANEAWDYPADSLGFTTGFAAELNQPVWALRYGFFQMPRTANGVAQDANYLKAWGMVTEFERRYTLMQHAGTIRFLAFLNQANMGSYQAALDSPTRPADITATRQYRQKFGFGLNLDQELGKGFGIFARLGWSDGRNESWAFADVDRAASLGVSVKGALWQRPYDTFGLANSINGISEAHHQFFSAGGIGILAGDGTLTYALENVVETYYDVQICNSLHVAFDYQFVVNPAYNRDRGPVSILGARIHWEY